jgi:hypothetical protein
MNPKKEKEKEDKDESSQYDDLIPRSMLPEKSVIPEWRQFGYGIEDEDTEYAKAERKKKQKKKEPKKMASGGYVRAADGIAKKGRTRGKMV